MELTGFSLCHLDDDMHSVLREKRVILGLTQKQVAEKANMVLQQYQKFESGERNIMTCSFQTTCRILEALEIDITDFYHGEYTIGEEVYNSADGLHYVKTGKSIEDDVE